MIKTYEGNFIYQFNFPGTSLKGMITISMRFVGKQRCTENGDPTMHFLYDVAYQQNIKIVIKIHTFPWFLKVTDLKNIEALRTNVP